MGNNYELVEVSDLDESQIRLSRTRAMIDAARGCRGCTLVRLVGSRFSEIDGEGLVTDIEIHVPPENRHGFQFVERFLLWIPENDTQVVKAFALRKDFPVTMHQNATDDGTPIDLCLYQEPVHSILRTWTPQKFIKRIKSWVERMARDELHAQDQPVEQVFFDSQFDLILPAELRDQPIPHDARWIVGRAETSSSYFAFRSDDEAEANRHVQLIELKLPPIEHGVIERESRTLKGLAATLSRRDVDLIQMIVDRFRALVASDGGRLEEGASTILLLNIPITRDGKEEKVQRRAYWIGKHWLQIAHDVGAVIIARCEAFSTDGLTDYRSCTAWHGIEVFPMNVRYVVDDAEARRQSGIDDPGPVGVLVGAGSLGSTMLDLWTRAGWGQWTVIDHDRLLPHNLVRHRGFFHFVGLNKADVASFLHHAAMKSSPRIKAIAKDACAIGDAEVENAITTSGLVVDATTTLEYPRMIARMDAATRHISTFITPNGNAGVLLAEDSNREFRMDALEAQYYRAVLSEPWGLNHLDGDQGVFWSGAGCRDTSLVISYSTITAHAATLAEQVRLTSQQPDGRILVWAREPATGAITRHEVPISPVRQRPLGDTGLTLVCDAGLIDKMREFRAKSMPNETGGILVGYVDFLLRSLFLVDALPAPSDSRSSPAYFDRGNHRVAETVAEIEKRTRGVVSYVGEWHSHPGKELGQSRYDRIQAEFLAECRADDGLPAVQLIVGEHDFAVHTDGRTAA